MLTNEQAKILELRETIKDLRELLDALYQYVDDLQLPAALKQHVLAVIES